VRYFLWVIAVYLSFFLQARITVLDISPDLTVLIVFYIGLRHGETRGLLAGVLIGAIEDSLSYSFLGPNMLAKGVVGFASSFFVAGGIFRWTNLLGIIVVFMLTFVDNALVFISRGIFDKIPAAPSEALFVSGMQSLLNASAGIFIRPRHVD
jgi:rod shape-determining protein MreD